MKLWETEKFTLDLITGELARSLSHTYVPAINFEQAQQRLVISGRSWLRLTGNWFNTPDKNKFQYTEEAYTPKMEETTWYDKLKADPTGFLGGFNLDQLFDWLDTISKEEAQEVWITAIDNDLTKQIKIIEGYLMFKYGNKENK